MQLHIAEAVVIYSKQHKGTVRLALQVLLTESSTPIQALTPWQNLSGIIAHH